MAHVVDFGTGNAKVCAPAFPRSPRVTLSDGNEGPNFFTSGSERYKVM